MRAQPQDQRCLLELLPLGHRTFNATQRATPTLPKHLATTHAPCYATGLRRARRRAGIPTVPSGHRTCYATLHATLTSLTHLARTQRLCCATGTSTAGWRVGIPSALQVLCAGDRFVIRPYWAPIQCMFVVPPKALAKQ